MSTEPREDPRPGRVRAILGSLAVRGGQNAVVLVIGLGVAGALLEGSARVLANWLGVSPYMRYDETLGWTAAPGVTKRHRNSGFKFDVTYSVNAHGQRGPFYDRKKPVGVYRIVILGDSNAFGWGIPEDMHFAAILDRMVDKAEVINLALSGFGTDQEYLRLREEGLGFEPDVVILQVTANDFDEIQYDFCNQKPKPRYTLSQNGELQLTNVPARANGPYAQAFYRRSLPLPFREWLGWHSYAYNWLNGKYYGIRRRHATAAPAAPARFSETSIALFKRIVSLLKSTLDQNHIQLLIVHASAEMSARDVFPPGIRVLDLSQRFAKHALAYNEEPMFGDGYHWSVVGHRIVAEVIAETLNVKATACLKREP